MTGPCSDAALAVVNDVPSADKATSTATTAAVSLLLRVMSLMGMTCRCAGAGWWVSTSLRLARKAIASDG